MKTLEEVEKEEREFDARRERLAEIARSNATTALDQIGEYADKQSCIDSYEDNVVDTIREQIKDIRSGDVDYALNIYAKLTGENR